MGSGLPRECGPQEELGTVSRGQAAAGGQQRADPRAWGPRGGQTCLRSSCIWGWAECGRGVQGGDSSRRYSLFSCSPRLYGDSSKESDTGPDLTSPLARTDLGSSPQVPLFPSLRLWIRWGGPSGAWCQGTASARQTPARGGHRACGPRQIGASWAQTCVCRGRCEVGGRWRPSPGGQKEPGPPGVQEGQPGAREAAGGPLGLGAGPGTPSNGQGSAGAGL